MNKLDSNPFVQSLVFTNDGHIVGPNGPFRAPGIHTNGFKEMEFSVTRTTNYGGLKFPLEAQALRFSAGRDAELDVMSHYIVRIISILSPQAPFAFGFVKPAKSFAEDSRMMEVSNGPLTYSVTNDVWVGTDDSDLYQRARSAGQNAARRRSK